ncbi:hypothetical protein LTR95_015068 [Oleoguttula sp. CCFEE 5521]
MSTPAIPSRAQATPLPSGLLALPTELRLDILTRVVAERLPTEPLAHDALVGVLCDVKSLVHPYLRSPLLEINRQIQRETAGVLVRTLEASIGDVVKMVEERTTDGVIRILIGPEPSDLVLSDAQEVCGYYECCVSHLLKEWREIWCER